MTTRDRAKAVFGIDMHDIEGPAGMTHDEADAFMRTHGAEIEQVMLDAAWDKVYELLGKPRPRGVDGGDPNIRG